MLPFAAVITFFTVGICRHPNYTLTDYLLYNSSEEEKTTYLLLNESNAHAGIDEGHVAWIIFEKLNLSEKDWQSISLLPKLKKIDFSNTNITDDDLQHLNGLIELEDVDLRTTQVTDSGIKTLKKSLPNLKISR
jgi:hypothetical protein